MRLGFRRWWGRGLLLAILATHATAEALPPSPSAPPPIPPSPRAPEPGMIPLPYFRSYFYPGPSPTTFAQPFNLSLPGPPMKWFMETESGIYRTPQNRHVFGPFPALPTALLLQGRISMGGSSMDKGTQGALYVHQKLYYNGGAEMGWVYFNTNLHLATYMSTDSNLKTQNWMSHYAPDSAFINKALSFRMGWDTTARRTTARVYSTSSILYDLSDPWPYWMDYNRSAPWYITITWQRNEDAVTQGLLSGASLWYIPGGPGAPAAPPQPQGTKGSDDPGEPAPPQEGGEPVPVPVPTGTDTPAPAPEPSPSSNSALAIGLGVGLGCVGVAALTAAAVLTFKRARRSPAKPGQLPAEGEPITQKEGPAVEPTARSHVNPMFDAPADVAQLGGCDAGRSDAVGPAVHAGHV